MKPASNASASKSVSRDSAPGPPPPTGDALIDEIRAMKYELSARFGHDIDRLGDHLKTIQEDIARDEPNRVIRQSGPKQ